MTRLLDSHCRDATAWRALLGAGRRAGDLRLALTERLAAWVADRGLPAAALYAVTDGVAQRVAATGASFPERFGRDEQVPGATIFALPAVRLVVQGALPDAESPETWLLAAGVRIHQLERQLEEQHFQARFRGVELEALYDVGLAIASTLDLESLGEEVLLRAVSLLDARCGALYLLEDGRYRLLRHLGGGEAEQAFDRDDARIQDLLARRPDCRRSPLADVAHLLAVPVEIEGQPRGLLLVADKESRRGVGPFAADDRRTLSLFANQAAIALENAKLHRLALEKERLEREMELAAEIQQRLLPKAMPTVPCFDVAGWNRPARQVGGDYYDLRQLGDHRWTLVVGDVTGKGMPAALLVSTLRTALRLLGDRMAIGPELGEQLSKHIFDSSSSNKFITMILGELDDNTGVVRYLNAGHNPGVLVRAAGDVETLASGGMPLGLLPGARFADASVRLEAGDLLCFYSDGITEAADASGDELGLDRLSDLLVASRARPLPEVMHAIDDAVSVFSQGLPQGDDQTVVLVRRRSA